VLDAEIARQPAILTIAANSRIALIVQMKPTEACNAPTTFFGTMAPPFSLAPLINSVNFEALSCQMRDMDLSDLSLLPDSSGATREDLWP